MSHSTLFHDDDEEVTCIAYGDTLARGEAREYDKYGDRLSRDGKQFEYLCKPCYRDCCHQNRDGLEDMLIRADTGHTDQSTFLRRYCELTSDDTAVNKRRPFTGRDRSVRMRSSASDCTE